jgi:hypothetical protein
MDPGLIGGLVGSGLGVIGGAIGTYFSIKNTLGPRERRFMIRVSVVGWIAVTMFVLLLLILPNPYRFFLWIPYAIALPWAIITLNRKQRVIRADEQQARN